MGNLYERDFYRWAIEQAARMREKRRELEELGIDWTNVAEELDTLGRSEKRELRSRLGVLLLHLLKWLHQPTHQSTSWKLTIEEQRDSVAEVLADNPSLKPTLDQTLKDAYKDTRRKVISASGLGQATFPPDCPWTSLQVLDSNFLP